MTTKILLAIAIAVGSYLIGGLNGAIIFSKLLYKKDIREFGSGNPGFTNFKRVFGATGWLVLIFDMLKAVAPVLGAALLATHFGYAFQLGAVFGGFFTMVGHSYPVWYKFKGGKSMTTCIITYFFVDWRMALICMGVFLILLLTVKIMSISSIIFALLGPCVLPFFGLGSLWTEWILILAALLLVFRHRQNIVRLTHGEEKKFYLFGKQKDK
ncbi:MAG: glycerol-3-phosphate 1-O-acyltransferase PlsY [Clostridia bacterium]|nr:glycerol-3-phosphate 1-O-acyltransferase PlsY [Clostridia bacterium]